MDIGRISQLTVPQPVAPKQITPSETVSSFSDYLANALNDVNKAQVESAKLTEKYASGQVEDVHQVMIASQKSTVLLQLTMQVRNKVIESYQEIMRMQI